MRQHSFPFPGQHIDLRDPFDLISKKFHADRRISAVCGKDLHHISSDTKRPSVEVHVISRVLDIDQRTYHVIPLPFLTRAERNHHGEQIFRITESIDAGDGRNDHHIPPFHQCGCRRKT